MAHYICVKLEPKVDFDFVEHYVDKIRTNKHFSGIGPDGIIVDQLPDSVYIDSHYSNINRTIKHRGTFLLPSNFPIISE